VALKRADMLAENIVVKEIDGRVIVNRRQKFVFEPRKVCMKALFVARGVFYTREVFFFATYF